MTWAPRHFPCPSLADPSRHRVRTSPKPTAWRGWHAAPRSFCACCASCAARVMRGRSATGSTRPRSMRSNWTRIGPASHELPLARARTGHRGASDDEVAAVELLTRDTGDDDAYEAHIRRIAEAPGRPGDLARAVKRSDLTDRLRHQHDASDRSVPARPPYRNALERLATGTAAQRALPVHWTSSGGSAASPHRGDSGRRGIA